MTVAQTFSCWVPALPQRVTSSNAGSRSRRDPWSVSNAIAELKDEMMQALMALGNLPHFDRAVVTVTFRATNRRPKLEQCSRCLARAVGGNHPSWAGQTCICFRARDCGNYGGAPLKPILDGLQWMGIVDDDDYVHIPEIRLRIERITELSEEGILVEVEALGEGERP